MNLRKLESENKERRILVVDDERVVRHFTQTALSRSGFTVFAAESGQEAVKIFKQENGDFHSAIIDVELPDRTGFELAEEIHSGNPMLKIIMSSGYGDDEMRKLVVQDKRFRFLPKPYSLEELLIAINGCSV